MTAEPLSDWDVHIAAHTVAGPVACYELADFDTVVRAPNATKAAEDAVGKLHVMAGVPPWRPYGRQSVPFATVRCRESDLERARRRRR